jgi:hypothetical protein
MKKYEGNEPKLFGQVNVLFFLLLASSSSSNIAPREIFEISSMPNSLMTLCQLLEIIEFLLHS